MPLATNFLEEAEQSMELTVGAVLEGKVKSIREFGAFIALPENMTGLVHISEVANSYVSDIHQHLTEGQEVKVMVLGTEDGKVKLSIKRLQPRPVRENAPRRENFSNDRPRQARPAAPVTPPAPKTADQLFEEKLKQFMAESDSKISSLKQHDHPRPRRRK